TAPSRSSSVKKLAAPSCSAHSSQPVFFSPPLAPPPAFLNPREAPSVLRNLVVRDCDDSERLAVPGQNVQGVKLVKRRVTRILHRPPLMRVHQPRRNYLARKRERLRPAKIDCPIHLQQMLDRLPPLVRRRDVHSHVVSGITRDLNGAGEVPGDSRCVLPNESTAVRSEERPHVSGDATIGFQCNRLWIVSEPTRPG